jgi:uncharacterized C2H2 Zn-finger protein
LLLVSDQHRRHGAIVPEDVWTVGQLSDPLQQQQPTRPYNPTLDAGRKTFQERQTHPVQGTCLNSSGQQIGSNHMYLDTLPKDKSVTGNMFEPEDVLCENYLRSSQGIVVSNLSKEAVINSNLTAASGYLESPAERFTQGRQQSDSFAHPYLSDYLNKDRGFPVSQRSTKGGDYTLVSNTDITGLVNVKVEPTEEDEVFSVPVEQTRAFATAHIASYSDYSDSGGRPYTSSFQLDTTRWTPTEAENELDTQIMHEDMENPNDITAVINLPKSEKAMSDGLTCGICGMVFTYQGNLQRHRLIHTGARPHGCMLCHKRFRQSGTLRIHMRTHTGEKPYTCNKCGRAFSDKSNLWRHGRSSC